MRIIKWLINQRLLIMKNKICSKCEKEKSIIEFAFRNDSNNYRNICKICRNLIQKEYVKHNKKEISEKAKIYYKKYPWIRTFNAIKDRCNRITHKSYMYYGGKDIKVLITAEELKELWFRDKAYLMKKPTIDRKDSDGHYIFDNCEYIEHSENSRKDSGKEILQFNINGCFIKKWDSITEASFHVNRSRSSISDALQGRSKISGGFIWKYK